MPIALPLMLLAAFGITLWASRAKAPVADDMAVVPFKSAFQVTSATPLGLEKADAIATFTSKRSGESLHLGLFDDGRELRISKTDNPLWESEGVRFRSLWDESWDLGAFAAARPNTDKGYDLGIRFSPVRIAYGTLAPDLLVGANSVGLGVSAYIPPGYVGRRWHSVGLGLGYLFDYGRTGDGLAVYASLSTRF